MTDYIITVYCLICDLLKEIGHKDDKQALMSTAEILTVAIIAMRYFKGTYADSLRFFSETNYMKVLSKGQFMNRLLAIDNQVWQIILSAFSAINQENSEYIVDSFPLPVCSMVRVTRENRFQDKIYFGYDHMRDTKFFGLKIHMITAANGLPIEVLIEPASTHDLAAFKKMAINLAEGARIYADKAYTDYKFEDFLKQERGIVLAAQRKENALRPQVASPREMKKRKRIETTFSSILDLIPRTIRAVSAAGFILKVKLFVLAYGFTFF